MCSERQTHSWGWRSSTSGIIGRARLSADTCWRYWASRSSSLQVGRLEVSEGVFHRLIKRESREQGRQREHLTDQGVFWNNQPDPLVAHPQELGNVQEHLDALAIQIRRVGEVEDETGGGPPPALVPHGDLQPAGFHKRLDFKRGFLWAIRMLDGVRRRLPDRGDDGEDLLRGRPSLGEPLPERIAERGERVGKRHQLEVKPPGVQRRRRDGEKSRVVDRSVLTENLVEQMGEEVVEIRRRTAGDRPLQPRQSGLGSLRAGFYDPIGT